MKLKIIALLIIGVFLLTSCENETTVLEPIQENSLQKANGDQAAAKRYIVVLNDYIFDIPGVANDIAREHASKVDLMYKHSIKGFTAVLSIKAVEKLKKDGRVKYLEEDKVIMLRPPTDKPGKPKPDPEPEQQVTPWGISRVGGGLDGSGKTAWVIDSGVDLDHPDLNVDVQRCVSFVTRGKYSIDDKNGHGTHVAGTIAAIDNNIGVIGVAAGATVVSVRVLDKSGSGAYSWVIAGVDYVAANASNGDVANMSLGGPASKALDDAVKAAANKGIKFALSAGNESTDAGTKSPARVNHTNVFTISAVNSSDVFASFSNFNNPPVDYAQPGVYILSLRKGGGTTTMSGTSMAAPHMAGLLLLGGYSTDGFAINDPDGTPDPIASK